MTDQARRARRLRKAEEAMLALAEEGNAERAAVRLHLHVSTLRKRVQEYCNLTGHDSPVQAAFVMGQKRAHFAPEEAETSHI